MIETLHKIWHDFASDKEVVKAWGPIIVGFLTAAIGVFSLLVSFWLQRRQLKFAIHKDQCDRDAVRQREEAERTEALLNNFYSPMRLLRAESLALYELFARKEKNELKAAGKAFRTVTYLADGNQLNEIDQKILAEIVRVGRAQLRLIEKYSSSIHDSPLTELLGKLACHISVLRLASEGGLKGMGEQAREAVFPVEIDGALESAILRLQARSRQLRGFAKNAASISAHQATIDYYDQNAAKYYADTVVLSQSSGMQLAYKEFLATIPRGARILDAGCGVGRDTRYFIKRGYRVVSFDASEQMVKFCNQYPFAYCERRAFQDVDEIEEYDAVWACASLLHVRRDEFKATIARLIRALKEEGVICFSVKTNASTRDTGGRFFEYYSRDEIVQMLADLKLVKLEKDWANAGALTADTTEFLNFIGRKSVMQGGGRSS